MTKLFALISGILLLISIPPYLIDILKGKTKPQRTTWLIWSILGSIAFVSQVYMHATWSLVLVGMDLLDVLVVFGFSIHYGVGGWARIDKLALVIATIGVAISFAAHQPLIALLGVIVAELAGTWLTIYKVYLAPESETAITWVLVGTASMFGTLAVGKLQFNLIIYPIYIVVANYAVAFVQALGRRARNSVAD